ncbi:GHMP kinase [Methanococcus vannielii SB]|jgi:pantoate kinase|uniref:Pantoate kinase n=1 Tax=Methanococcus vannielii (strain ATCC 35089 / DSM 1224 / JCM 13029 / OCM 148 / SB) TaxID=406327 RepID=A6US10_METVS|nr:pantoate kinase [Methanococcus vannielii]ABR55282.1 GHMP kinase [Methanococcus vannielii SB]
MFIPSHITGFFKVTRHENLLKTGSTGAGITLNKGVTTKLINGSGNVYFNDEKIDLCPSNDVIKYLDLKGKLKHDILYNSDFPLGCGMGTSGCCALGSAHELKNAYDLKFTENNELLTELELLKISHKSEVRCNTGLGDVIAQHTKGFVIRKGPGFPINVESIKINNLNDYYVLVDIFGKKETDTIINNSEWVEKINATSDELLGKLLNKPTLENFMELSYYFAKNTGLASDEVLELCSDLKFTVGASQAMLGNALFCICKKEELNDALSILSKPVVCKIYC